MEAHVEIASCGSLVDQHGSSAPYASSGLVATRSPPPQDSNLDCLDPNQGCRGRSAAIHKPKVLQGRGARELSRIRDWAVAALWRGKPAPGKVRTSTVAGTLRRAFSGVERTLHGLKWRRSAMDDCPQEDSNLCRGRSAMS